MRRFIKYFGLVLLALVASSLPAAAQAAGNVQISGGYSFLRIQDDAFADEKNFPAGWYADLSGGLTNNLAVVGEVSGSYKTIEDSIDLNLHGFLGGVRLSTRANDKAVPFVQVLGGAIRSGFSGFGESESENDGALEVAGGVNLMPAGSVGLRLGIDYIRAFTEDEGTNLVRFRVGIVFGR